MANNTLNCPPPSLIDTTANNGGVDSTPACLTGDAMLESYGLTDKGELPTGALGVLLALVVAGATWSIMLSVKGRTSSTRAAGLLWIDEDDNEEDGAKKRRKTPSSVVVPSSLVNVDEEKEEKEGGDCGVYGKMKPSRDDDQDNPVGAVPGASLHGSWS